MSVSQLILNYEDPKRYSRPFGPYPERLSVSMVAKCLDAALRIWDEDRAQAKSEIEIAAAMLLSDATAPHEQKRREPTGRVVRGLLPWQARKLQDFIDGSLDSKIRVKDCADQVRLSTSYFSSAFRTTFGTTVVDYIHRRRIGRAQELMLVTRHPLSQIALACGFCDQSQYCRVFRAVVGLSPMAWRRQHAVEEPDEYAGQDGIADRQQTAARKSARQCAH